MNFKVIHEYIVNKLSILDKFKYCLGFDYIIELY